MLAMAWNAMLAIFIVVAVRRMSDGQIPYVLLGLIGLGAFVGFRVSKIFVKSYVQAIGIGSTTVEIEDLPLVPGRTYRVVLVQYGSSC